MAVLVFVSGWLVVGPQLARRADPTPGAGRFEWILGTSKLAVEVRPRADGAAGFEYRFLDWPRAGTEWLDDRAFQGLVAGEARVWSDRPFVLKLFNASSYPSLVWVALGLLGQSCFFGRMLIQWVASERQRESVVPALFWWLSLFGGALLFVYFVWRVDLVGVLGQSTGIVVYARNLRLIRKQAKRRKPAEPARSEPQASEDQ
jgi:lipid-A-disaccharide synthase-like uncharacterized protein